MHIFNWFFLFIIGVVIILHIMVNRSMLAAGQINQGVDSIIYLVVGGFTMVWLILYIVQIKTFGNQPAQICLVLNGLLTGFWVMIYAFLNVA